MSDLYLDLKRRIPVVAEWTDVGTDEMERAQARLGLSDERLARLIPVSAKTWVRWKRRGQIPTQYLSKVAPILGFEIVPLDSIRVEVPVESASTGVVLVTSDLRESLAVLVDLVRELAQTAERIEQAIPALAPPRRRARRSS